MAPAALRSSLLKLRSALASTMMTSSPRSLNLSISSIVIRMSSSLTSLLGDSAIGRAARAGGLGGDFDGKGPVTIPAGAAAAKSAPRMLLRRKTVMPPP